MSKILKEAGEKSVHFTRLGEEYEVKKVRTNAVSEEKVRTFKESPKSSVLLSGYMTETPKSSVSEFVKDEEVGFVPARSMQGFGKYGCGCQKEEGKNLCTKHGRV